MSKITLTLTFDSLEEAIEYLAPAQPPVTITATPLGAFERPNAQPQTEKKPRKPRADAGVPRGPYKDKAAEAPAETAAPAGPEASPVVQNAPDTGVPAAAVPAPLETQVKTEATAPKEPTLDDVKAAMSVLSKKKNIDANIQLLAKFGVQKASALPTARYAEFIAAAKKEAGVA